MRIIMRKENGSATLFVLVAMIFITIVLLIIYMNVREKNNNQLQEINKIQEEYQMENIEQEYEATLENSGF